MDDRVFLSFFIFIGLKPCGNTLMVNKKMDITSPNFPDLYPPDKTCVWRLCPPRSYRIKFHFNVFQLHSTDSINIDNGKRIVMLLPELHQ